MHNQAVEIVKNILAMQFRVSESESLDESVFTIEDFRNGKAVYRSHYAICLIAVFDKDGTCIGEWEEDEPEGKLLKEILWPITWAYERGKMDHCASKYSE